MDPRNIEAIEDLGLKPVDTWYALLVAAGEKPAAWLHIKSAVWREGEVASKIDPPTLDRVKTVFEKAGVYVYISTRVTDAGLYQPDSPIRRRFNELADILVAVDQATLERLRNGVETMDHTTIGTALGYPDSAVSIFDKPDQKTFASKLDPEYAYSKVGQLTFFALSKGHWRQELKVVEKWIDRLKEISPMVYIACCNRYVLPDEVSALIIRHKEELRSS